MIVSQHIAFHAMNLSGSGSQQTFITYVLTNNAGHVVYVGRARGAGTPERVLQQRLSKGHHVFDHTPGLSAAVQAYQGNQEANMGAEDVWYAYYRLAGSPLLNDPQTPPLSARPDRLEATRRRIQAYADDLKEP